MDVLNTLHLHVIPRMQISDALRIYIHEDPPPPHAQVHEGYVSASLSLIPTPHTLHICRAPQMGHAVGLRHRASRDGGQGSCCEDGQEVRVCV